jgi:hypothetical protein
MLKIINTNLQSSDGSALETQISLEVLSNLTHETLEWQLADEQLSRLSDSDGSRGEPQYRACICAAFSLLRLMEHSCELPSWPAAYEELYLQ